jgi:hypothetical protein
MPTILNTATGTALTELYKDVLPECPGLAHDFALHKIRDAAIDFCSRTWVWQSDYAGTTVISPTVETSYTAVPPEDSEAIALLWVKAEPEIGADQKELKLLKISELALAEAATGAPQYFTPRTVNVVTLYPDPDDTYDFTMRLVLRPTRDAAVIDDDIFTRYRAAIAHGAMYMLMSMARKPWSDPTAAVFHGTEYTRLMREARIDYDRTYSGQSLMVELNGGFA